MKIENREIIKTEKSIIVVKNDEDLKINEKMYGAKRFMQERTKARDEVEANPEFKKLIESIKNEGKNVFRETIETAGDEEFERYVQVYQIK